MTPATQRDAAEAWQIADDMAREAATLRDRLAEVWSEAGEMRRVAGLLKIQRLVDGIKREVDESVRRTKLTPSQRNKEWLAKQARINEARQLAASCGRGQGT